MGELSSSSIRPRSVSPCIKRTRKEYNGYNVRFEGENQPPSTSHFPLSPMEPSELLYSIEKLLCHIPMSVAHSIERNIGSSQFTITGLPYTEEDSRNNFKENERGTPIIDGLTLISDAPHTPTNGNDFLSNMDNAYSSQVSRYHLDSVCSITSINFVGGKSTCDDSIRSRDPVPFQSGRGYLSSRKDSIASMSSAEPITKNTYLPVVLKNHYPLPLPGANAYHNASMLLVDISGFTKLSTMMDVENLSKTINNYFDMLLREVEKYGGDVLKFAGDAFYAEWKIEAQANEHSDVDEGNLSLEQAVVKATLCGASIVRNCSDHKVIISSKETNSSDYYAETSKLDVHCGVGVGELAVIHVGNNETRREFLVLGDPIAQASQAEGLANHGELAASPEVINILKRVCIIPENISTSNGPSVIASKGHCFIDFNNDTEDSIPPQMEQTSRVNNQPSVVSIDNLAKYYQLSLYIHPAARRREPCCGELTNNDYHVAEAELRSVYVMFIMPLIDAEISGDSFIDHDLFQQLNDIMVVTTRELDKFGGHLRQFIVDDKGVVLIATFGLRGSTFPNMVAEKGLPATKKIHDALQLELDIDSRIGATLGRAYCGIVGGVKRHEFAVLGPSVNLAARLMANPHNSRILVDDGARLGASKRFDFLSLLPVNAKGYLNPVKVYEPLSTIELHWDKINGFVGRENEVSELVNTAKSLMANIAVGKPQMVLVQADSGQGKSSMVIHAIEKIRKIGDAQKVNVRLEKKVCKDDEQRVPFGLFRRIMMDVLKKYEPDHADLFGSVTSDASASTYSIDDDAASGFSTVQSDLFYFEQLYGLCKDMQRSKNFANMIGENILGLRSHKNVRSKSNALPIKEVLDFIAEAFLRCTSSSDILILAIDDVQWMDSLSWDVVRHLYSNGTNNLMIVCVSRPLETNTLSIDPEFLDLLREEEIKPCSPRFKNIKLSPLSISNVRSLLSISLNCPEKSISKAICDYVYDKSGGMPYFAQEIARTLNQNNMVMFDNSGVLRWKGTDINTSMNDTFTDLNDLLLHRLDSFDEFTRRSLQIFAVLGFEFSFSEVLAIQCHGLDNAETSAHMKRIQEALDASVKENILEEAHSGEKRSRKNTEHTRKAMKRFSKTFKIVERQYTFSHAMWRNCVLGTMLNETERDIHRFIANIMEGDNYEVHSYISAMKLFHHWKASGDIMHASLLAMKIGKHLENLLLQHQVIDFYFEVISMWKDFSGDESEKDVIAGMGHGVLSRLTREELDCLARLHTSIAKAYANIGDGTNASLFYSNCDFILTNSPAAADLKDRTVFFILYSAQFGLLQSLDVKNKLVIQTELAKKFVEQAQIHGDPVHIARALAMEGLVLAGRGMFEDAIDAQKRLEKIYFAEKHSAGVINEYATDRAAQSYGYSVIWYATLGRHEECQAQIDFILDNLLPKMPKKNVHNSFMILFQSLWVLKDRGHVRLAEFVFVKHIYDRFNEYYSKGSSTFFYVVYEPIRVLLRLAVESKEGKDTDERKRKELEGWILSEDFFVGSPGKIRAIPMCSLGRDPHCIIAEICLLLAAGRKTFDERRMQLLRKGAEEANKSNKYTQCNPGYAYSQKQSLSIMGEIQRMIML